MSATTCYIQYQDSIIVRVHISPITIGVVGLWNVDKLAHSSVLVYQHTDGYWWNVTEWGHRWVERSYQTPPTTGWSKATVTHDLSPVNLKSPKNADGKLICGHFGICMAQYDQVKKVVPSKALTKWCFGSMLQGLRTQTPQNTSKRLRFPRISLRYPQISHRHPSDIFREHDRQRDNNSCQWTLRDVLKQHLSVSWGVWRCLLASVDVCWHLLASLHTATLAVEVARFNVLNT